jgi:hypothetical protein
MRSHSVSQIYFQKYFVGEEIYEFGWFGFLCPLKFSYDNFHVFFPVVK